jgi:hypothetical protein
MATRYYYSQASGANDGTSEADAFTDLQTAYNACSGGDVLYCKKGPSREGVKTTNLAFNTNNTTAPIIIEGYGETPGDGILYETASPVNALGEWNIVKYFDVDKDDDSTNNSFVDGCLAYRCKFKTTYAFGKGLGIVDASAIECYVEGQCSASGDEVLSCNRACIIGCYIQMNFDGSDLGDAVEMQAGFRANTFINNVVVGNGSIGSGGPVYGVRITSAANMAPPQVVANNTIVNFTDGIREPNGISNTRTGSVHHYGNVIYDCTNGIKNNQGVNSTTLGHISASNAFGNITTAQHTNIGFIDSAISLTESPFVDTTHFALNNAPGGGALLKGKLGIQDKTNPALTAAREFFDTHGANTPIPIKETSRSF